MMNSPTGMMIMGVRPRVAWAGRFSAVLLAGSAMLLPGAAVAQFPFAQGPLPASEKGPIAPAPQYVQAMVGKWGLVKSENIGTPAFSADFKSRYPDVAKKIEAGQLPPYESRCVAFGVPGLMSHGFWLAASARAITIVAAEGLGVRVIALDKTAHTPENKLFPSWNGDTISHREGDTLVVDTIGLTSRNQIAYQVELGDEQAHIVERFHLKNPDELQVTTTLASPKSLIGPWTYRSTFKRLPLSGNVPFCAPQPRT